MSLKDFQILQELGEGAYSKVYKVRRIADGLEYALKKVKLQSLSDKEKQNALNEVRILASVRHANVIQYKEAFLEETTQSLCIVMEYADDGDLFQKIVECQKKGMLMAEKDIWNYFIQIVKGLKALHDMKIYHRDLKSANVFMNVDGTVKLGDMNVSKVAKKILLYTQTGTPYYASPEVWKDQPYDSKSDIWSLGCVLYEMTTLKPPFRAEDMNGLYKKVVRGYYPKIPTIYSQDLSNIIRALLQVQPHLRPSCDKILQLSAVINRMDDKVLIEEEGAKFLLQTIRVPRVMHYLTDRLPKPNYAPIKMMRIDKNSFIQTLAVQKSSQENVEDTLTNSNIEHLPRIGRRLDDSQIQSYDASSVISKKQNKIDESYMLPKPSLEISSQGTKNTEKLNLIHQIYAGNPVKGVKKNKKPIKPEIQILQQKLVQKKLDIEGEPKPLLIKNVKHQQDEKSPSPFLPALPAISKEKRIIKDNNEDEQLKRIKQTEEQIQLLKEKQLKQKRKYQLRNSEK
ncbi:unnamed protein product [Paramecium sonneborni]|uniref:non-specific serine/threonine protein kinase n=1 Tax=Paramecium sonneborni TaxID=65129 RepID=A0A8S1NJ16_9CILI|nr:unnamed protein product [Paramecium sonneborni]